MAFHEAVRLARSWLLSLLSIIRCPASVSATPPGTWHVRQNSSRGCTRFAKKSSTPEKETSPLVPGTAPPDGLAPEQAARTTNTAPRHHHEIRTLIAKLLRPHTAPYIPADLWCPLRPAQDIR